MPRGYKHKETCQCKMCKGTAGFQKGHKSYQGTNTKNSHYTNGIVAYRRLAYEHFPKLCSMCGATKNLYVHHKDQNRMNNKIENLIIVCRSCHCKIHDSARFMNGKRKKD